MAIDYADFFSKAGKAFHAAETAQTAVLTTVAAEVEDFTQEFDGTTPIAYLRAIEGVRPALVEWQAGLSGLLQSVAAIPVSILLVESVAADVALPDTSPLAAVVELVRQMIDDSESVEASTVGATATVSGTVGNGKFAVSVKRPDGLANEQILAETIVAIAGTVDDSTGDAIFSVKGEASVNTLSHLWPSGSGASATLASTTAAGAGNLVSAPSFEDADAIVSTLPDAWIVSVGTIGTTVKLTSVEVQTVIMSGTPTAGYYRLHFTNRSSKVQTTNPLAYNATGSDVQAALRLLKGLEDITVVTTGTTPNYTHTITFTGVPNPGQLTSTDTTTGGTHALAHATTTAGSAFSVRGARALELDATGAEQTTIQVPVTLAALTQYALSLFAAVDVVPAAGVITVDLIDGVGGSVINDEAGTANSFTITAAGLTTTPVMQTGVFRTPSALPPIVYLRIRQSTAISAGTSAFLDEVQLKEMTELYTGGVWAAAFTGSTDWELEDRVTIAATNDRAGELQEWMDRTLSLRESRILIPSVSGGGETILDSVIG